MYRLSVGKVLSGGEGRRVLKSLLIFGLLFLFNSCFREPEPDTPSDLSREIRWRGFEPGHRVPISLPDFPLEIPPLLWNGALAHRLDFFDPDSMRMTLIEFSTDFAAYAFYQMLAGGEQDVANSYFRHHHSIWFLSGRWVGEAENRSQTLIPIGYLKEGLGWSNEEYSKPKTFQGFPRAGRLPHSERVHIFRFLGHNWPAPVFSAKYFCHGDTAIVFWMPFKPSEEEFALISSPWQGRMEQSDGRRTWWFIGNTELDRPLLFYAFFRGVVGVEGCYDPVLSLAMAQKMQEMSSLTSENLVFLKKNGF